MMFDGKLRLMADWTVDFWMQPSKLEPETCDKDLWFMESIEELGGGLGIIFVGSSFNGWFLFCVAEFYSKFLLILCGKDF